MILRVLSILFVLVFTISGQAFAGAAPPVPPTCNPDINTQLNARAWMGAKRDMESAQTIITRHQEDSILELSCFDRHLNDFALQNQYLFSDAHENFSGPNVPGLPFHRPPLCFGPGCLCTSLVEPCPIPGVLNIAGNPFSMPTEPQIVQDWITPGMFPVIEGPNGTVQPPINNQSLDNAFNRVVRNSMRGVWSPNFYPGARPAAPAVVCNSMATIWQTAKCTDFDKNGFITLDQHRTTDRRNAACNDRGVWGDYWTAAHPPKNPDQVTSYNGHIYTNDCSTLQPIPTGLVVSIRNANVNDAVCPAVNCHYDGNACTR